jgi:hypothetical protein
VLLAQTITLQLNIWLSPDLGSFVFTSPEFYTRSSSGCGEEGSYPLTYSTHFLLPSSVYNALGGSPSVQAIFDMANNALGGISTSGVSLSNINAAVDIINRAFDECAFIYFIPVIKSDITQEPLAVSSEQNAINLSVSPNPFENQTSIAFSLLQDSKVSVEIYNVIGSKISTLYEGLAMADQVYTFNYDVPGSFREQVLLCVIRTQNGNVVKRMVLVR